MGAWSEYKKQQDGVYAERQLSQVRGGCRAGGERGNNSERG